MTEVEARRRFELLEAEVFGRGDRIDLMPGERNDEASRPTTSQEGE